MRKRLKIIGEACYMVPLGAVLLCVILTSLFRKYLEDRWNDPTRPQGRWTLIPFPW